MTLCCSVELFFFGKTFTLLYFIYGYQFLQSGVKWLSDAVASALNTVIQYVTEILESSGIDGNFTHKKKSLLKMYLNQSTY